MDTIQQLTSHPQLQQLVQSPVARKTLGTVAALGLARYANRTLSRWASNNWTSDSWQGDKEVVLVTGGAGGIGKQIMEDLSRAGVRVVIIDISEPGFKLRASFLHPGDVIYCVWGARLTRNS